MGTDDKIENKAQEAGGKIKEGVGDATNDDSLKAEGKSDQTAANLKQAGEKVKDALGRND
ncbi:CsbD family protein [Occultella aeris]|uniref:CsbD-like protein n=1 Tax=Occultella aeris TaxID=2761496 RepID=A0A7M4DG66_9MICO|nr:CsbD family protein [Occultella aeris]VZO35909.1 CsbD-like protein [Occultella aeris]